MDNYILLSSGRMGYYRVNYSPNIWQVLTDSFQDLPNICRAQLIDDALNLARAGLLSYHIAFALTSKLRFFFIIILGEVYLIENNYK